MDSFVPMDWKPVSRLAADITVELKDIVNLVMMGRRLPSRDPYLIDVCLAAIKEIQRLRAAIPKIPEPFLGGEMS